MRPALVAPAVLAVAAVVLASCHSSLPPSSRRTVPPVPGASASATVSIPPIPTSAPGPSLGPNQPPLVWIGGTLSGVTDQQLTVREDIGSIVLVRRLAQGATSFFRVNGDRWEPLGEGETVAADQTAC